jgi:hypothetical protein
MRFLSPTIHGFIDYAAAIALIVAPFLLLPDTAPAIATWFSVAAGSALILYSLITDYSASVRKALPFSVHLIIDLLAGIAFVAAPFVLGFEGITKLYYLVMGAAVILVVLVTDPNGEGT